MLLFQDAYRQFILAKNGIIKLNKSIIACFLNRLIEILLSTKSKLCSILIQQMIKAEPSEQNSFENQEAAPSSSYSESDNLDHQQQIYINTAQCNQGVWNEQEILKLISFIVYNRDGIFSKLQRRANRVFKQMSIFVGTRTPTQCRSQNQKMFRKYKTTRKMLAVFKKQYGATKFERVYQTLIKDIKIRFKTENQLLKENNKVFICAATQTEFTDQTQEDYILTGFESEGNSLNQIKNWRQNLLLPQGYPWYGHLNI